MSSRKDLSPESVELQIYIDNDRRLYDQKFAIQKNLATKFARGIYSHTLAPQAFAHVIERGAREYAKEFGSSEKEWNRIFSKKDRDDLAGYFTDEFEIENKLGSFDHVLPKKYQVAATKKTAAKRSGGGAKVHKVNKSRTRAR